MRDMDSILAGARPLDDPPPGVSLDGKPGPVILRMADVKPERVRWLWPGRIPLGKLTLIAGDPGLGKSMATIDLAARVSAGAAWPDRSGDAPVGGVLLVSAEDDPADTIRPRLEAAGADVDRVGQWTSVLRLDPDSGELLDDGLSLDRHWLDLESAIGMLPGCRLVVVDPITAYLGRIDGNDNAKLRGLLRPLSEIAGRTGVALVVVTHLNKGGTGRAAIYRAMGSLATIAAARAAWIVAKDRDDPERRLFLAVKNNLGRDTGGLAFTTEDTENGAGRVVWSPEAVHISVDDALAPEPGETAPALSEAVEWLRDRLAERPMLSAELERLAEAEGIAVRTLKRARKALGVEARQTPDGWVCYLPEDPSLPA